MSWREDLKVGLLRADQLFIGTANGGLGEDVTAALLALAGLGGGPLVTDVSGDVYAEDGVSLVFDSGTDGTDAYATLGAIRDPSGAEVYRYSAGFFGSLDPVVDPLSSEYILNFVRSSIFQIAAPSSTDATVLLPADIATARLFSDDSRALADLQNIGSITFIAEDASVPGNTIPFIGVNAFVDTMAPVFFNLIVAGDTWRFMSGILASLLNEDGTAAFSPGLTAVETFAVSRVLAVDNSGVIASVAAPAEVPASIADTRVSGGFLSQFQTWSIADLVDQGAAPGPNLNFDLMALSYNSDVYAGPLLSIAALISAGAGVSGDIYAQDYAARVLSCGADGTDAYVVAALQALDSDLIIESIANPGEVPADVADAKVDAHEVYACLKHADAGNAIGSIATPGDPSGSQADSALVIGDIDALGGLLVSQSVTENNFFTGKVQALNADVVIRSVATPAEAPADFEDTAIEAAHFIPQVDSGAAGAWSGVTSIIPIQSGATITGFTPQYIGQRVTIWCADSTADANLTCGAGVTFDGTNDNAVFADDGDAIEVVAVSLTRWLVVSNIGAVAFN